MKLSADKPKELYHPAEMWYYVTSARESDVEKLWTSTEYGILRSHEPMMYRNSYDEYVERFNAGERKKTYEYMVRMAAVTRDTVDQVYEQVTTLPDFKGWLV